MFKKFLITICLIITGVFAYSYELCNSIKCPACEYQIHHMDKYGTNICTGCYASRRFERERDNGYKCMIYVCDFGGHVIKIPYNVKPNFTIDDVEVCYPWKKK